MSFIIREEKKADYLVVESIVRDSFWNVYRPGATEHFVLHKMRESKNFIPQLSLVLELDGKIIGQIAYLKASLTCTNGEIEILTFGPMCISPEYQHKGYGKILLDYSLNKANQLGFKGIAIEGNIDFYGKSGFEYASNKGIGYFSSEEDFVPYFLIKELEKGFFDNNKGIYKDPEEYFVADKSPEEFEEYDKNFPLKK